MSEILSRYGDSARTVEEMTDDQIQDGMTACKKYSAFLRVELDLTNDKQEIVRLAQDIMHVQQKLGRLRLLAKKSPKTQQEEKTDE